VESVRITPEPDDAAREAILEALAAEKAERASATGWVEALLPARGEEDAEP
jgi:hypothetical protein